MSITPGTYQHYKGHQYQVLGIALHTETREKLVVYKPLYQLENITDMTNDMQKNPIFVRPLGMFTETVIIDGEKTPRFKYLTHKI